MVYVVKTAFGGPGFVRVDDRKVVPCWLRKADAEANNPHDYGDVVVGYDVDDLIQRCSERGYELRLLAGPSLEGLDGGLRL